MFNASKQSRWEEGQGRRSWRQAEQLGAARHVCIASFPSCCCRALSCLRRRLSKDSSGAGHGTETWLQLRQLCRQTDSRAEIVRLHTATTHTRTHTHKHTASSLSRHLSRIATCAHHRERNKELVVGVAVAAASVAGIFATCVLSQEAHRQTSPSIHSPLPLEFPLSTLG